MSLRDKINSSKLPVHIAIIMDGNGRWAAQHGHERVFGHQKGVEPVRNVVEAAAELGIGYLTLYAFSTENWGRPDDEVSALMELMVQSLNNEKDNLLRNNIKLIAIGDFNRLAGNVRSKLFDTIDITAGSTGLTLILALSYSSKWEITEAVRKLIRDVDAGVIDKEAICEEDIEKRLTTSGIPDPDLLIRTSGELRVSNFLLWQLAYTEFYFTDILWPDFGKEDLYGAIVDFQNRVRRFGKTSEQILEK